MCFYRFSNALAAWALAFMRFAKFFAGLITWMYAQAAAFTTDTVVVPLIRVSAVEILNKRLFYLAGLLLVEAGDKNFMLDIVPAVFFFIAL